MTIFLTSVEGVLIILVMILIGYLLAERNWFPKGSSHLIARLVTQIALPADMLATITRDFNAHRLETLLPDLRYPLLSMFLLYLLSFIVVKVLGTDPHRQGLFKSMFSNSNTIFIGLPVNMALFGATSLPFVLVYYMANTSFFWTLGVFLIQQDGPKTAHFNFKQALGKIFSPPLLGFLAGIAAVFLRDRTGWVIPTFLMKDLVYLGNLTVPLSMIFIGIAIHQAGLKQMTFHKDNWGILGGRFILAPALMTALVWAAPMPVLMKQVFILQAAMPVMTNAPVVAQLYGADADYAAIMVTETTLLSLIVIPILMTLTAHLPFGS